MNGKLIGGILLIVGTSIGGGMLALPIATAQGGFLDSITLLIITWVILTYGAFLILEVNLWFKPGSNLVTMARNTLGPWAELVAWIVYLLLLYSLLSAYMAGGSDILQGLLQLADWQTSQRLDALIFLMVLGPIVYCGIRTTDYANRALMSVKLLAYLFLVILIIPQMNVNHLSSWHIKYLVSAITVVITSFGYATIIPTVRGYLQDDIKKLRIAILIGSLIPLVTYLIWISVILAEIPLEGDDGLIAMLTSTHPTTLLVHALHVQLSNSGIETAAHLFTSLSVATSFLGVSLSLSDFLADGLGLKKQGWSKLIVFGVTFLPPLALVFIYPAAFLVALSYAGIFVMILLVLLPACMVWWGRYNQKIAAPYQVVGGKLTLLAIIATSLVVVIQQSLSDMQLI